VHPVRREAEQPERTLWGGGTEEGDGVNFELAKPQLRRATGVLAEDFLGFVSEELEASEDCSPLQLLQPSYTKAVRVSNYFRLLMLGSIIFCVSNNEGDFIPCLFDPSIVVGYDLLQLVLVNDRDDISIIIVEFVLI
jgi:hypothetical protein